MGVYDYIDLLEGSMAEVFVPGILIMIILGLKVGLYFYQYFFSALYQLVA